VSDVSDVAGVETAPEAAVRQGGKPIVMVIPVEEIAGGAGIGASGVSTSRTEKTGNFVGVRKKSAGIGRGAQNPVERPAAFGSRHGAGPLTARMIRKNSEVGKDDRHPHARPAALDVHAVAPDGVGRFVAGYRGGNGVGLRTYGPALDTRGATRIGYRETATILQDVAGAKSTGMTTRGDRNSNTVDSDRYSAAREGAGIRQGTQDSLEMPSEPGDNAADANKSRPSVITLPVALADGDIGVTGHNRITGGFLVACTNGSGIGLCSRNSTEGSADSNGRITSPGSDGTATKTPQDGAFPGRPGIAAHTNSTDTTRNATSIIVQAGAKTPPPPR
jgi:hypothetical protein